MTESARTAKVGTIGGTPLTVATVHLSPSTLVKVRLTATYATAREPGYPARPDFTGCAASSLDYPRNVASGTTLTLLKPEADALVTAGGATYV